MALKISIYLQKRNSPPGNSFFPVSILEMSLLLNLVLAIFDLHIFPFILLEKKNPEKDQFVASEEAFS